MTAHGDVRAVAAAIATAPEKRGELLRSLDLEALSANAYGVLRRALEPQGGARELRVAYLGNITLDLLPDVVAVQAAAEDIRVGAYLGGFGQHVQEVLDPGSGLHRHRPDLIVLALALSELQPERMADFAALGAAGRRALRDEVIGHVDAWATAALRTTEGSLLIANFAAPPRPLAGVADQKSDYAEAEFYLELNLELLRRLKPEPRLRLLDVERLGGRFGKDRALDRKLLFLARMEWAPAFLPLVAGEIVREIRALTGMARKCLVLDLDNTLWGGVLGEDGPAGVKVGEGDPVSRAFLAFQQRLKALQAQGVLLAICSKNNPADVAELFETRPDMPLRRDDFAAVEIGWAPKHEGLRRIAANLNLGLQSLVFVDDNPAEAELVRQMLPEVCVAPLPRDPADYLDCLDRLREFERPAILADDLRKTEQYRQNRARSALRGTTTDLRDYLASLETRLEIRKAEAGDLARAHQLFAKTNQFNVTSVRYSPADLARFAAGEPYEFWLAAARDRFGDLGVIAAVLLERDGPDLRLDSLLMSCRAMGRGIETALMNHVKARLVASGCSTLRARYAPTPKNAPVERLFEEQGLKLLTMRDGEKLYQLPASEAEPQDAGWIEVLAHDAARPARRNSDPDDAERRDGRDERRSGAERAPEAGHG